MTSTLRTYGLPISETLTSTQDYVQHILSYPLLLHRLERDLLLLSRTSDPTPDDGSKRSASI